MINKIIWICTHHKYTTVHTFIHLRMGAGQGCNMCYTSPLCVLLAYTARVLWMISFPVSVSLQWREILKTLLKQLQHLILLVFHQVLYIFTLVINTTKWTAVFDNLSLWNLSKAFNWVPLEMTTIFLHSQTNSSCTLILNHTITVEKIQLA